MVVRYEGDPIPPPTLAAPVFSQFGGNFAGGFNLSITNPNSGGTIYYTLDGSDPRVLGGGLNPTAKTYSGPIELLGNINVNARCRSTSGVSSALVERHLRKMPWASCRAISTATATARPPTSRR